MREEDFYALVNLNWGSQARVLVEKKWFPGLKAWQEIHVVVYNETLFKMVQLGEGARFDLCWKDIVKNYPNVKQA